MANQTVLVLGKSGQLARCLLRHSSGSPGLVFSGRADGLSLQDRASIERALDRHRPRLVINAAAYTAVDQAESQIEEAFAVNRDGPAAIAENCRKLGIPLIHVSTDYVFDGTKHGEYVEGDPIAPVNAYGASKAAGEQAIRDAVAEHVILRTSWVYSPFGANFVKTMLRVGASRPEIEVVDDQWGRPTSAQDLASAVMAIAETLLGTAPGRFGTYHLSGGGEATTWFGFAERIFELAASRYPPPAVKPIPTSGYPTAAKRPFNSLMDCSKIRRDYQIEMPDWKLSLAKDVEELLGPAAV